MLTEQTIETKKNRPHKREKILVEACATTAQHSIDENYNVFLWDLWLKSKLKDSHTHVKEND